MRSMATALFDYNTALVSAAVGIIQPTATIQANRSSVKSDASDTFRFGRIEEVWPTITSPIPLISSLPQDPFDPELGSYRGAAAGNTQPFLIIGMGPDGDLDLTREVLEKPWMAEFSTVRTGEATDLLGCPGCGTLEEALRATFSYSPTNGTFSNGDLIRFCR
jgi:hypothetical protein